MTLEKLENKKIAVLGLGIEGVSLINFFIRHKIRNITVCDQKEGKKLTAKLKTFKTPIKKQSGKDYLSNLEEFDILFRSPGIPYLCQEIQNALKKGVELCSATKLFFSLCKAPIVGITGTKGKGTTASLLFQMLKSKQAVYFGGNVGIPMMDFVDRVKKNDLVILELSSFQLQDLDVAPKYLVVQNIFCDHQDVHKSFKEYKDAKLHLVKLQKKDGITIINESLKKEVSKIQLNIYTFGRNVKGLGAKLLGQKIQIALFSKKIELDLSKTKLLGEHNYLNIASASLCATILGVPKQIIQEVIDSFKPLPHRLEFVRELCGVKYYNDSLATIPESVIAALKSFPNYKIVIIGGKSKGVDFSKLAKECARLKIRKVILMGECKEEIERALKKFSPKVKYNKVETLKEGVNLAFRIAKEGDTVLLSPGCSSFDMFFNYKERGKKFREYVDTLKKKR